MHPTARYLMEIGYPMINRMDFFLKDEPVQVEDKAFTDVVTYTLVVRCADEEGFLARLSNMSEGAVEPLRYEELYLAWPEEDVP
jgi:putative IMPACT (imprinted ancient) family translation regulator